MNKSQLVTLIIVAAFIGLLVGINSIEPSRVSARQQQEAAEAAAQIAEAEAAEAEAQAAAHELSGEQMQMAQRQAPSADVPASMDPYQVEFTCSNGTFVVEIHPEWAPIGAEQFRKIIEAGIYNEARFFRVVPKFVVQWGIPGDPELAKIWGERNIMDEPRKMPNERGTLVYAKSGMPNSRTTQVYINLSDDNTEAPPNPPDLDSLGFAPFGKVIKGMDVVDAINAEHGQDPEQSMIETRGNAYLKEYFPKLDYIKEAKFLKAPAESAAAEGSTAGSPGAAE